MEARDRNSLRWAIRLNLWTLDGFGPPRYEFGPPRFYGDANQKHRCGVLLFATRREAREFLRPKKAEERERADVRAGTYRGYWLHGSVVKVRVSIAEVAR